jgi:hypothetical protein
MSHQFNNEFCTLDEEQRKDPLDNLLDVIGHKSLFDHRKELFTWLGRVVTNPDYRGEDIVDLEEQFWYFQLTLKCVERLHRIHNMIQAGELIYSYKSQTT